MSNKKNKKLTPFQREYQNLAKGKEPKRKVVRNCLKAFVL